MTPRGQNKSQYNTELHDFRSAIWLQSHDPYDISDVLYKKSNSVGFSHC